MPVRGGDPHITNFVNQLEERVAALEQAAGIPTEAEQASAAPESQLPSAAPEVDLEDMKNEDLRDLAEEKGIDLPGGYVTNTELIKLIKKHER